MKAHVFLACILTIIGLLGATTAALADCTTLDLVDIGNTASESGHAMAGWGPIEPATSGGNYGGIADCRAVYAPEDGDVQATIALDFGDNPAACKYFTFKHLDGLTKDSFEVWVGGVMVYAYAGDDLTTEVWYETTIPVCTSGVQTVKFVSTAPQWASWATYGQMCFDILKVEECPADCTTLDEVDVGDATSESGHGMDGWGPIEPATSGGNYGGIDDCRAVYAPEDMNDWATIDMDFGDDPMVAKCLTFAHLEGIAVDAFDLYIYPQGLASSATLLFSYAGDAQTSEIWLQKSLLVNATGKQTLKFVSTEPIWSSWLTYGQICIDFIRVDECPPVLGAVDIGKPASEAGYNPVGWGPIEPAASGGNYGGIDDCRAVWSSSDNDDWATLDFDFGCCEGSKCLVMEHLDGMTKDSFEVYQYPVGDPGAAQLIFTYPGDDSTAEVWLKSSVIVTGTGPQTLKFVSTQPQWASWATYGQMCFNEITLKTYSPVMDVVIIGDTGSEAGHALADWGPIEPLTSGGSYGGVDQCRAIYAPEDNDVQASLEMDFGYCAVGTKCLTLYHLDGLAKDAFDLYIYPVGGSRPATPFYSYPGDDQTQEMWFKTSLAVDAVGRQVVEFVSTEPTWSSWSVYGQVCFSKLVVSACAPHEPTPYATITGVGGGVPWLTTARIVSIAPNPFNPQTEIAFELLRETRAQLIVFDIRGHRVRTLVDEVLPARTHVYRWRGDDADGLPVASGVYFVQLSAGDDVMQVEKMTLIR